MSVARRLEVVAPEHPGSAPPPGTAPPGSRRPLAICGATCG